MAGLSDTAVSCMEGWQVRTKSGKVSYGLEDGAGGKDCIASGNLITFGKEGVLKDKAILVKIK